MRTARDVTPEKLRGGFYTPPDLVQFCLQRVTELAPTDGDLRVLEPSVGDGAFLRGLGSTSLRQRVGWALGIEVLDIEAEKARQALKAAAVPGTILSSSAVEWSISAEAHDFDLAVGNPPFVRFQFVSQRDRVAAERLAQALGISFRGVSNLWIAVLLAALRRLRAGGAFAFVVPTECFTGCSAQVARDWLLGNAEGLHFDLFPPGSFPGVLQEIAVMSGRRAAAERALPAPLRITEHDHARASITWAHSAASGESWTRYLLEPKHLEALAEARALIGVADLWSMAAFEVSIVTGANGFFSVDRQTVSDFALAPWARPLLPRIRHAEGLIYNRTDQGVTEDEGARAWLLDFAADRPDPQAFDGPSAYLRDGEQDGLHERYKCRIRTPWYRVPGVRRGELLMSKRSHAYPRVIVNEAGVFTTDTIYRGRIVDGAATSARALAATFHNSLTLLTAEIEGRGFGGGVLELVPSEVGRLSVPVVPSADRWLGGLDRALRAESQEHLIEATDHRLAAANAVPKRLLETLGEARAFMAARRLDRNATELATETTGAPKAA